MADRPLIYQAPGSRMAQGSRR